MAERLSRLSDWAWALKRQVTVLWFALRDPRMPAAPKLVAVLVVAYALSPLDLIPDFIPLLGYLDDLLLLPLGIWLALRLTPAAVLEDARRQAEQSAARPSSPLWRRLAGAAVLVIWAAGAYGLWWLGAGRWW